ncbi:PREDICTED: olfactory receptor 1G1-like [Ceratotherium simum simum]|uniref:Olfactory receptor n=1 Tax=Ceratotherium simum simum TaxID=73337 RepID=A0ABM1D0J1_CERSS|nr:PREDICTED: olfactory receptor 1G1-like [Ceratotherium simum simum]
MGWENLTDVSEFFLLGLSEQPEQQEVLFGLFLSVYLVTVVGNLLIILAIITDAHLHTPMYFFLANLSLADTCFVSTTVPKMLANIWTQNQVISYAGCLSQLYFFMLFVMLEAFLLAVMAYDRYVAICHPLHYIMVMSPELCVLLVSASWIMNALHSLLHTLLMNSLSFCEDHKIPHFFCDINPLLSLSCADPFINELLIFTTGGLAGLVCVLCLIIFYAYIFLTILKIPSAQGKRKAFSTCSSHLSVVSLFFGTSFCVYFSPPSTRSAQMDTVASVMYTVVTPMLNPFIYSLRNRDIKSSLTKLIWVRKIHLY